MYSTVELLPSHVIDHIAAGEVIERPASVVKELLENSVDAGATSIQIDIEGGGLSRITISDDGKGMTPTDTLQCYFRHATSKLRRSEELFTVETLGFRGEALSSIASVSQLTISTRRQGEEEGFRVVLEGGKLLHEGPTGCPLGTTINVENLFYNTPARKKFLRSPATEQSHIIEACLRVALGKKGLGLVLTSGKRRLLDIPESTDEGLRVRAALGKRVANLFAFAAELDGVKTHGFVTKPEIDRGDTKGLWFFINGRYIRDRMLQRAVLDGYQALIQRGRYPIVIMNVEVNPSVVDVNVHPQKLEVRFSDGGPVFRSVSRAIATILTEAPWAKAPGPSQSHEANLPKALVEKPTQPKALVPQSSSRSAAPSWNHGLETRSPPEPKMAAQQEITTPRANGDYLIIGNQFYVAAVDNGLRLVDLKEAASRWSSTLYLSALLRGDVAKHSLIFPEVLELTNEIATFCAEHWESFPQQGFEIEPVGPQRFALRAIPLAYAGAKPMSLVKSYLAFLNKIPFSGTLSEDHKQGLAQACEQEAIFPMADGLERDIVEQLLEWAEKQTDNKYIQKGISCDQLKQFLA